MASNQTILVTGASGFVGSYILKVLLEKGYNVRATVRSESSSDKIKKTHPKHVDRLSFFVVKDITASGAFDEALKGISDIIHSASPFVLAPENNERDLLIPAIKGTTNVLEAAKANGNISRVVITSSFAANLDLSKGYRPGYTYTYADWNPATYEEASVSDDGSFAYCASKALAERAAWEWMEKNKPNFTLSVINPPWIFGPSLAEITSLEKLNESTEAIYNLIDGSQKEVPPVDFGGFADVRDVAQAHLRALERKEAANQRLLVGVHFDYQLACECILKHYPELEGKTPKPQPGAAEKEQDEVYKIDGSKAEKVLGLQYTPLETTIKDTVAVLLEAEKRLKK